MGIRMNDYSGRRTGQSPRQMDPTGLEWEAAQCLRSRKHSRAEMAQ